MPVSVGIDLGYERAVMAVCKDGKPSVLINLEGDDQTPAVCGAWNQLAEQVDCVCVFFNNCRHGQAAKNARRFAEIAQANRGTGATEDETPPGLPTQ